MNINSNTILTESDLRKSVSSIFTETPMEGLTDKYKHLTTWEVVEDMNKLGWDVVDAKQVKARKGIGYQKHLLIFRNKDLVIEKGIDNVHPQILLTNSHDGKSSFKFTIGLFRTICENGLVIAEKEFQSIKIRHMGYKFDTLKDTIKNLVSILPNTIQIINKMMETELDKNQVEDFAKKAIDIRFGENKNYSLNLMDILKPVRKEDEGNSLWNIFNIIQEKMIKGDLQYTIPGKSKPRKARPIKNFIQDIKFNEELYELATEYIY